MASGPVIDVYVGSMPSHELVVQVLEWSLLRHGSRPLRVHRLHELMPPLPPRSASGSRPGTAFSFQRFAIPEITGYRGRALYLDSDQIVFRDIARAFDHPMRGQPVLPTRTELPWRSKPQLRSSVMLLDCARLDWSVQHLVRALDAGELDYAELFSLRAYRRSLPARWNGLDRYHRGWTALLHYTAKSRQPWIHHRHKLGYLWFEALFAALDAGHLRMDDIERAVHGACVRPSLLEQVRARETDARRLPAAVLDGDREFYAACAQHGFNNTPGDYRSSAAQPAAG